MMTEHCQDLRNSCFISGLILDLVIGQDLWSVSAVVAV